MNEKISALASVNANAKIADRVRIGPFSIIEEDVHIGEDTIIHSNVTILKGSRIGERCEIYPGAIIGSRPQDLKFEGEETTVEIGDDTVVREFATINRGTRASGTTRVGTHSLIMAYVHIAHDCIIGDHCILSNNTQLAGHVIMEDYAITGGMTGVLQFTRIGKYGFLSGGTLISKDVAPYTKVIYTPGNYAGLNLVGLRRRRIDAATIQRISDIYKWVYHSQMNLSQAIVAIEKNCPSSQEKDEIIQFMKTSKNGVIKKTSDPDAYAG